MLFIKQTGLFQQAPAVNCRAGTGCKHLLFFLITGLRFSLSSGKRPAKHIIVIPCIVDFITFLPGKHLCAGGKRLWMTPDPLQHFLHKSFLRLRVVVQQDHVRLPGAADPFVHRPAEAIILIQLDPLHFRKMGADIAPALVGGTVVHQIYGKFPAGLLFQRRKARLQILHPIIIGNDDCCFFH